MKEIVTLLLNEDNIAGLWAVIGALSAACITFLGIFANNFFENRRRKKEREHTLIREAYFGTVEYIAYISYKISTISNNWASFSNEKDATLSEKYYKLYLVGSSEVISTFTRFSKKNSRAVFDLLKIVFDLQRLNAERNLHQQAVDNALEQMKQINTRRDEYNQRNTNNAELWKLYERQYNQSQVEYEDNMVKWDVAENEFNNALFFLMKQSFQALLDATDDIYDVILLMRKDLERKLNKKDVQSVKSSLDSVSEQLKEDISNMLSKLEEDIDAFRAQ